MDMYMGYSVVVKIYVINLRHEARFKQDQWLFQTQVPCTQ